MKIENRYNKVRKVIKKHDKPNEFENMIIEPYSKKQLLEDLKNNKMINSLSDWELTEEVNVDLSKMNRVELIDWCRTNEDKFIKKEIKED